MSISLGFGQEYTRTVFLENCAFRALEDPVVPEKFFICWKNSLIVEAQADFETEEIFIILKFS
jgi:hypothetical protein